MPAPPTTSQSAPRLRFGRWAAGAALFFVASSAWAEPYLAVRTGLKCSSCHLNRTGGGGRTTYGAGYGRQTLPPSGTATLPDLLDGSIGKNFRIGADFRGADIWDFREDRPNLQQFEILGAQLYLFGELIPDRLSFYVDERVAPGGAFNREAFLLVRSEAHHLYFKGGRFFLPFGWRLQDDDAATRRNTGFSFDASDTGVEVGYEPGPWSLDLAITNGAGGASENNNGKQYTFSGSFVHSRWRLGLSAARNELPEDLLHQSAGLFGGFRAGPVVVLGEWDLLRDESGAAPEVDGGAAHAEVDWLIVPGITARVWAGSFDPDRDVAGDDQDQAGLGVDWTPLPGLQVRALYRMKDGPDAQTGSGDDRALVELHLYF